MKRSIALFAILTVVACSKEQKKDSPAAPEGKSSAAAKSKSDDGDDKKQSDSDQPSDKKEKKAKKKPTGEHVVGGVEVPAWSKRSAVAKCKLDKSDKDVLANLQKGEDGGAGFDDGEGDVDDVIAPLKKKCATAPTLVSQALNAGGYTRYSKKEYEKANGWFARALVADAMNTFARYNLACNLALQGKTDEALWNLEQLVPAARANDPRALHYLTKARSDSDLASANKDARFKKATAVPDEAVEGVMPCPKGEVRTGVPDMGCVRVCSAVGGQGGCPAGKACMGAMNFGDGLVPYCSSVLKCKDDELEMHPLKDDNTVDAKPACFRQCGDDAECGSGKSCTGTAAMPTMYGFMFPNVCK